MERLVKFEVLGQEYPLYTDAPEDEVREIMHLVKSIIEEQHGSMKSTLPANKVAVLTSLNMAGKYVRMKREFEEYRHQVGDSVEKLTNRIESTLQQSPQHAAIKDDADASSLD